MVPARQLRPATIERGKDVDWPPLGLFRRHGLGYPERMRVALWRMRWVIGVPLLWWYWPTVIALLSFGYSVG